MTETALTSFRAQTAEVLDELLARHPESATVLGDHRFDDRLQDRSRTALDDDAHWVARRLRDLGELAATDLDTADRVDLERLTTSLELRRYELEQEREHEWNPLVANPGTAIYALLARDFAPLPDRLRSVGARLALVPAALEEARRALSDMPRVHVETAIGQFAG
ncbi:MAG: DUF885 family protein, partial [Pseudonocardiaceae bacterium]